MPGLASSRAVDLQHVSCWPCATGRCALRSSAWQSSFFAREPLRSCSQRPSPAVPAPPVIVPFAGHDALRRIGDSFRDQRAELGCACNHRARGCLSSVRCIEARVADLAPRGRARADCGGSRGEARCKHFTAHCRLGDLVERVVARSRLLLRGFGHRKPPFRSCRKDTSTAERFRFAKRTVPVIPNDLDCPDTLKGTVAKATIPSNMVSGRK